LGSQEEAKDAFKGLLRSVGVNSDWHWEQAMKLIVNDKRCARHVQMQHLGRGKTEREEGINASQTLQVLARPAQGGGPALAHMFASPTQGKVFLTNTHKICMHTCSSLCESCSCVCFLSLFFLRFLRLIWDSARKFVAWHADMCSDMPVVRYGALKSLGEKKACFNEYLQQRKNEEKDEARQRAKRAREEFTQLLEQSPKLNGVTRYPRAQELLEDDARWKVGAGLRV
jgi:FF domain